MAGQVRLGVAGASDAAAAAQPAEQRARATSDTRVLVVVLGAEVGDQLFAAQVAQRVLELHELDEQIVLGVQPRRGVIGLLK